MSNDQPVDLLELYLLEELSEEQIAVVERWLKEEPTATETLAAAKDRLQQIQSALASPADAEALGQRIIASVGAFPMSRPIPTKRMRRWLVAGSIAASVIMSVILIWNPFQRKNNEPTITAWNIHPTENADYVLLGLNHIRLERGELYVEPDKSAQADAADLTIETVNGTIHTSNASFYVGAHQQEENANHGGKPDMKPMIRVLVLAGMLTLSNPLGNVTGEENQLLAAEPNKPPVNLAVQANSDFAFDLYMHIGKENRNMFFSPYSISTALAMVAEGARGETAAEMGKVLRYPPAARRVGNDAQLLPWNVAMIHTGMARLNEQFRKANAPPPKKDVERLAVLEKELLAMDIKIAILQIRKNQNELDEALKKWDALHEEFTDLKEKYNQYELRLANALWGEKSYPFAKTYVDTINKYYETGGVFPVDFIRDSEGARKRINSWTAEQTHGRIKEAIAPDVLTEQTRLVLTNAIYFKGLWVEPFTHNAPRKEDFFLGEGKKISIPMMWLDMEEASYAAFRGDGSFFATPDRIAREKFDVNAVYPDENGFQMLELPFRGDEIRMRILLPRSPNGLPALEKKLTSENLQKWAEKLENRKTTVFIPKFKLETNYDMKKTLREMGMVRAFKSPALPMGAQLDGIFGNDAPDNKLFLSQVIHKTTLNVNEEGIEASASTSIAAQKKTEVVDRVFVPDFKANKPFLFMILDQKTGTILFLGRLVNPDEAK